MTPIVRDRVRDESPEGLLKSPNRFELHPAQATGRYNQPAQNKSTPLQTYIVAIIHPTININSITI